MSNSGFGTPPTIPSQFQIYDSYVEDPKWQLRFTEIWAGCLGLALVLSLPTIFRAWRAGRVSPVFLVQEYSRKLDFLTSLLLRSPLGVGLNLGQRPGNGYEKLNYLHRWSGRGIFLGAVIHGCLWIRNHIQYGLPILGPQKETSGVAAFTLLCIIVLSSLKPVRVYFRQVFFYCPDLRFFLRNDMLPYPIRRPWIFPPLGFYGLDLVLRLFRYRVKDAFLTPMKDMTIIHIGDCDDGWEAGQHVRLRVFFEGRVFESHPLTIANAPASISCVASRSIILGARVSGDWTRALSRYASSEQERIATGNSEKADILQVPVHVMIDGPYGGCSLDLGDYEDVLLVAGGRVIVRQERARNERTLRVEFVWIVRSVGYVQWFKSMLLDIAEMAAGSSLDLNITIFLSCLFVTDTRPDVHHLLARMLSPPRNGNAVARLAPMHAKRVGGIALHTEVFSL
ncbi:hypothetical protein BGW80DRAFT_1342341 [Lactifluus volemus]|nr:hypothetical protein BGW80DRAFT_1342341 [Lactifluus volemus]